MRNANHVEYSACSFDDTDGCAVQDTALAPNPSRKLYARAVQALRDVRHLLPPEGVAIVDAVLDGAVFEHGQGGVFLEISSNIGLVEAGLLN